MLHAKNCTFQLEDATLKKSIAECYGCIQNQDQPKNEWFVHRKRERKKYMKSLGWPKSPYYLYNGMYAPQIANLLRYYTPNDLMIFQSQTLWDESEQIVADIYNFLDIDQAKFRSQTAKMTPLERPEGIDQMIAQHTGDSGVDYGLEREITTTR